MDKIKYLLAIWSKLANHIHMRDRSVKILQYGCQMLLGFYATKFGEETVTTLRSLKYLSSTSRKAFWLFKSVNHIGILIDLLESYSYAADEGLTNFLDILEQIALIVYYWYENLVFFSRTKLVTFGEEAVNCWGNISWFIEDFVCFLAALIRTFLKLKLLLKKTRKLAELGCDVVVGNAVKSGDMVGLNGMISDKQTLVDCNKRTNRAVAKEMLQEVKLLKQQFADHLLGLTISTFEVGASAEAAGVFKIFIGRAIGDAGMGLCGVVSSTLILIDGVIRANRELTAKV